MDFSLLCESARRRRTSVVRRGCRAEQTTEKARTGSAPQARLLAGSRSANKLCFTPIREARPQAGLPINPTAGKKLGPKVISTLGPNFTPGNDLLSHRVAPAVSSAHEGLTTVFGMGTGVSPPVWSPENC